MAVKFKCYLLIILSLMFALVGCATIQSEQITKIALLAPFEGRYREVGYNALYASRLAIADSQNLQIELLAIDDGGQLATATQRARAIQQDSTIDVIIILGQFAADENVVSEITETPIFLVGYWGTEANNDNVYSLYHPNIADEVDRDIELKDIDTIEDAVRLHDGFALEQLPELTEATDQITLISSGNLPDVDFHERYVNSDQFVPEPGLLATLTYDATSIAIQSIQQGISPSETQYDGINGMILFDESGYWVDAPINTFTYVDGSLVQDN